MINSDKTLVYSSGTRLVVHTGQYSDTVTQGVFLCLKECHLPNLVKQYLRELSLPVPDKTKNSEWAEIRSHRAQQHFIERFIPWMIKNGYWEEIEVQQVNLGDYYFEDEFLR